MEVGTLLQEQCFRNNSTLTVDSKMLYAKDDYVEHSYLLVALFTLKPHRESTQAIEETTILE